MEGGRDDELFVYTGGEQVIPRGVRRVRIYKSVKIIPARAFLKRENLIYVEFHDGIEIIEKRAFDNCPLLSSIKLLGVKVIEEGAFNNCSGLTDVEFGDKLETIEVCAFANCFSLRSIMMPSVRTVGWGAFENCRRLADLDLPEGLDTIGPYAFRDCPSLRRITMPLKDDMIRVDVFYCCPEVTTVDLNGGIHKTISSLHLESWRNDMMLVIDRINQVLPNTNAEEKTAEIRQWIRSVIRGLERYKSEHHKSLKEATTLLELALWKAKIDNEEKESLGEMRAKKAKIDIQSERNELRITSGASIVIKNVLPFLQLQ